MFELNDICVVVPVYNEEKNIASLLSRLLEMGIKDIHVVDGGSSDKTVEIAEQFKASVIKSKQGRAIQMNAGAMASNKKILWFIHADTLPPIEGAKKLLSSIAKGNQLGCFRFKFDSNRPLLRLNSFMTRFNTLNFRGGDQGIFILKAAFIQLKGFDEAYCIMEEYDFLQRANSMNLNFDLIADDMLVSARKYKFNSYLRVNWANYKAMRSFHKGVSPEIIKNEYHQMLNHPTEQR